MEGLPEGEACGVVGEQARRQRLAGHSARFDTRFLQLGIHPGGGHTWMMRSIVGPQATAATVLFGEVLGGPEAERAGLVWRCVPDDDLLPLALDMAATAARQPRELVQRARDRVPYEPEPERFGGESALTWAEEHFHVSTRVVLDRIARPQFTYGDAMFDALRLHVIAVYSAGFTKERSRWYYGQLYDQWLPLFFAADEPTLAQEITDAFEKTFAPQKEQLRATLEAFWKSLLAEKLDAKQPEWTRWLRGNQMILNGLEENLAKSLPSLIHLTNNRLGINNQDEVYLNFILSKTL